MSRTTRSACRNKPEDWMGFVLAVRGKDVAKQINAIVSSKRYHKVYRQNDEEAIENYERDIDYLLNGVYTDSSYYIG